ncbi:MAG: winged helix-turn-helix domain-containing protein [Pseudomonadota bacterium]
MSENSQIIVFEEFSLHSSSRTLLKDGERVHLPKKPFDVLVYLIERRGELVTREDLLERFWGGADAYDEAVYRCLSSIRKALDDNEEPARFLETRWREGYSFIATVEEAASLEKVRTPLIVWAVPVMILLGISLVVFRGWSSDSSDVTPATIDSIAVLPVEGRGLDEWLLAGLTDELIHVTSNIEGIRVISAATIRADNLTATELGDRLGASALLMSRLQNEAPGREMSMRLVSATDGTVLWSFSEPYDAEIPTLSSSAVITNLASRLSARLRSTPLENDIQEAMWKKYLQARQQWKLRTPQSIAAAISLYEDIISAEPQFSGAYAGLGEAYTVTPMYTGANPSDAYGKAKQAANAALAIDPDNARAHVVLAAYYAYYEIDWPLAENYFARAIEIDPNNALAHHWKADASCYRLLFDDCRYHMSMALRLDPLSPSLMVFQGVPDRFSKQFVAAEQKFKAALEQYPDLALARFQLGLVLDAQGRHAEAIDQWERIYPQYGPALLASSLANAYAQLGQHEQARELHADLQKLRDEEFVSAIMMAGMTMTYGTHEEAIDWLEIARDEHDDFYSGMTVIHHFFELHDEPRFVELVEAIGVSAERFVEYRATLPTIATTLSTTNPTPP